MSDTLPQPFGYIRTDIHGNACEVLGYTVEQLAAAVAMERDRWEATLKLQQASYEREIAMEIAAERERIIAAIPGGCSVDPQWVCDMIRAG